MLVKQTYFAVIFTELYITFVKGAHKCAMCCITYSLLRAAHCVAYYWLRVYTKSTLFGCLRKKFCDPLSSAELAHADRVRPEDRDC